MSPGRFFEGAEVAFSIVIESCKLIGNIYKTKFVYSLSVGVKYCQIAKFLPALASLANIGTGRLEHFARATLNGNREYGELCRANRLEAGTRYKIPEVQGLVSKSDEARKRQ